MTEVPQEVYWLLEQRGEEVENTDPRLHPPENTVDDEAEILCQNCLTTLSCVQFN